MILLKNGRILKDDELVLSDVLIDGERIVEIAPNITAQSDWEVKDVEKMWIIPAGVDVHAHLREPGFTHKETVKTGTMSAAKGGIGTIIAMPNVIPAPDCVENLSVMEKIIEKDSVIRTYPSATVSIGERGEELSDFKSLNGKVVAFTDDGLCVNNLELLKNALKLAKKPIASHAEAKGEEIPEAQEYVAVGRELDLLRQYPNKYHFCHLSTKRSFELVKKAREEGLDVTCEVMPHHLFLNKSQIVDSDWKMNPPLRDESDRQATVEALLSGVATMIATDHAPHSPEEKAREYKSAPNGIIGFETMFPLVYTNLVRTGLISHGKMLELTVYNPAERFGLIHGDIKVGGLADVAVLDIENEHEYTAEEILSKSRNTPFIGFKLYGFNALTLIGGKVVYERKKR